MINAFDLTAGTLATPKQRWLEYVLFFPNTCFVVVAAMVAFTYEAATQNDGMHFIGPPMKMIVTKLFHHLCHDVVNGTPL